MNNNKDPWKDFQRKQGPKKITMHTITFLECIPRNIFSHLFNVLPDCILQSPRSFTLKPPSSLKAQDEFGNLCSIGVLFLGLPKFLTSSSTTSLIYRTHLNRMWNRSPVCVSMRWSTQATFIELLCLQSSQDANPACQQDLEGGHECSFVC